MRFFNNMGLAVTENTTETATAQIALLVKHREVEGGRVEASLAFRSGWTGHIRSSPCRRMRSSLAQLRGRRRASSRS